MPTTNLDRNFGGYCKIRKRVSSSSNSNSSVKSSFVKNYRLKRPVLKMALRSPSVVVKNSPVVDKGKEAKVSARRLAASLWEINGGCDEEKENSNSKADYSPLCKDGSKLAKHKRRTSDKLQLIEYVGGEGKDSYVHHGISLKVSSPSTSARLKDLSTSLTTSKELIKVLFRMCSQEDRNSSNLTLVSALKVEIDRARHHVDRLMQEKKCNKKEIDGLIKHFGIEKAKEQERYSNSVSGVVKELEIEKKMRRQTERINKTLGRELADTKTRLKTAMEDLECEMKAREMIEKKCDECEKVREETERERQMLQLADVLREERVQMKLADARYEYEEKNEALERLRNDLEASLGERGEDSVDEMFKGRRSLNEKIQWESICLERKTSDKIEFDFTVSNGNRKTNPHGFRKWRVSEARGDEVLLLGSGGGEGCSRLESLGELVMDLKPDSVDLEDRIDGNYDGGT